MGCAAFADVGEAVGDGFGGAVWGCVSSSRYGWEWERAVREELMVR